MFRILAYSLFGLFVVTTSAAEPVTLVPDRVLDVAGARYRANVAVEVDDGHIVRVGAAADLTAAGAQVIRLSGLTLMPGMIDAHSHVLLHPYNETSWNDQVMHESRAERVARAVVHARNTLMAGFTSLRDLGTEGAGYADVGIQTAIRKGVIPGPRLFVATRAIVATGSYGPKGFTPQVGVPLGAEEADGPDLVRVVRDQIGHGAQWVKVYADYRWGPNGEARPTFSLDELKLIVDTARSSGRPTVAHAATAEGMRRAIMAGVETVEHGTEGTREVFDLMAQHGTYYCPTLAAGEAVSTYAGWRKGTDPDPPRVVAQKQAFAAARAAGVKICLGSDVGVFTHGDNAWEAELMSEYGMPVADVLRAATMVDAALLHHVEDLGQVKEGFIADLIGVVGDPLTDITSLRHIDFVMKDGEVFKAP